MDFQTAIALAGFAFATSITPGPNNLMLLGSGANYGFTRTLPHLLGVSLGHSFLILCCGLGLAALFAAQPVLQDVLQVVASVYLVWLAWKIGSASPRPIEGTSGGRPLTFLQAAAFQWVNPKGISMALGAITLYAGPGTWSAMAVAAVFCAVNLPSCTTWALLGTQVSRALKKPAHMRAFNIAMALLLLATLLVMLRP